MRSELLSLLEAEQTRAQLRARHTRSKDVLWKFTSSEELRELHRLMKTARLSRLLIAGPVRDGLSQFSLELDSRSPFLVVRRRLFGLAVPLWELDSPERLEQLPAGVLEAFAELTESQSVWTRVSSQLTSAGRLSVS